jgi:hypothetical protein
MPEKKIIAATIRTPVTMPTEAATRPSLNDDALLKAAPGLPP